MQYKSNRFLKVHNDFLLKMFDLLNILKERKKVCFMALFQLICISTNKRIHLLKQKNIIRENYFRQWIYISEAYCKRIEYSCNRNLAHINASSTTTKILEYGVVGFCYDRSLFIAVKGSKLTTAYCNHTWVKLWKVNPLMETFIKSKRCVMESWAKYIHTTKQMFTCVY